MSDWMSDAQKRLEEQRRQQEAERLNQQKLAEQARQQQQNSDEAIYQELKAILIKLGVPNKLKQIAQRYLKEGHETQPWDDGATDSLIRPAWRERTYTRGVSDFRTEKLYDHVYYVTLYAFQRITGVDHGWVNLGGNRYRQTRDGASLVSSKPDDWQRKDTPFPSPGESIISVSVSLDTSRGGLLNGFVTDNRSEIFTINKNELSESEALLDELLVKACERLE